MNTNTEVSTETINTILYGKKPEEVIDEKTFVQVEEDVTGVDEVAPTVH